MWENPRGKSDKQHLQDLLDFQRHENERGNQLPAIGSGFLSKGSAPSPVKVANNAPFLKRLDKPAPLLTIQRLNALHAALALTGCDMLPESISQSLSDMGIKFNATDVETIIEAAHQDPIDLDQCAAETEDAMNLTSSASPFNTTNRSSQFRSTTSLAATPTSKGHSQPLLLRPPSRMTDAMNFQAKSEDHEGGPTSTMSLVHVTTRLRNKLVMTTLVPQADPNFITVYINDTGKRRKLSILQKSGTHVYICSPDLTPTQDLTSSDDVDLDASLPGMHEHIKATVYTQDRPPYIYVVHGKKEKGCSKAAPSRQQLVAKVLPPNDGRFQMIKHLSDEDTQMVTLEQTDGNAGSWYEMAVHEGTEVDVPFFLCISLGIVWLWPSSTTS